MTDTLSAFQYYLGRYPESHDVSDWLEKTSEGSFLRMREALGQSDEFRSRDNTVAKPRQGTFFAPRPDAQKICVLGNCQGPNIAMALAALSKEPLSVSGLEIMDLPNCRPEMLKLVQDADTVVACAVFNPAYTDVAPETIRTAYGKRVLEYSPIHFTGFHPDILILGHFGERIRCPMGDYNSRIVLSAYLAGLSPEEASRQFNRDVYERAGYFNEFHWSSDTMMTREDRLGPDGIRIGEWLLSTIKTTPLLYTVNHPNSHVFVEFAARILDKLGISRIATAAELVGNSLMGSARWPIDPIIAEAHGTWYSTPPVYWADNVPMPVEEFAWRSYLAYDCHDRQLLVDGMGERAIAF
ncbi:WcbI family polysaccharide biosynthesis putative acetyltransferase [Sphingobium limneticum]|uniref:WcbI family polysaccharide biosynthesis putative acetyltransferase n=1 Tax=Sphingobium TaxID=165695 RepID=UPI0031380498